MKEKIKNNKSTIALVVALLGSFGWQGVKMCSDEAQEWYSIMRKPTPEVGTSLDSNGELLKGKATGIVDTNEVTKAVGTR